VTEPIQPTEVRGLVVDLDDLMATIEIGEDRDQWIYPRSMLPPNVELDSVLLFDGLGTEAAVIDHRPPGPSMEDRLNRRLVRRAQASAPDALSV
jgi:hypothetical protein